MKLLFKPLAHALIIRQDAAAGMEEKEGTGVEEGGGWVTRRRG